MQKLIILGFILAFAATSECIWPFKSCPNVNLQQNFNISSFLGVWYEVGRSRAFPYELGDCNTATYGYNVKDLGKYTVEYKQRTDDGYVAVQGDIMVDTKDPAYLLLTLGKNPWVASNQVLETDYTKYALMYTCQLSWLGLRMDEYGWIVTRNQTVDEQTKTQLLGKFDALGLKHDISFTNQLDCGRNTTLHIDNLIKEELG